MYNETQWRDTTMSFGADFTHNSPELYKNKQSDDEKISSILLIVGIMPKLKGYSYLHDALEITVNNCEYIHEMTTKLYPTIAERHSTTPMRVERSIRHAISFASNSGKMENLNAIFGIRILEKYQRPTNGEFISLVADKLIRERG